MSCLKNLEFLDTKIVWGNFNQRGKHRSILGEVLGSRRFHHSPSPHRKPTQPMKLFPCCLLETLITCCFPKMFLKSESPASYYPFIFWLFWTSALKETQKNRTAVEHGKVSQQRRILKEIAQMISEQSIVFNFCITRKQKHSIFTSFSTSQHGLENFPSYISLSCSFWNLQLLSISKRFVECCT